MLAGRGFRVLLGCALSVGLIGAPALPARSVPVGEAAPVVVPGPGWLAELPVAASRAAQLGQGANWVAWPNADGTTTARLFDRAVNWQDANGRWLPIDTRLIAEESGGFSNHAGPFGVEFAPSAAGTELVRVTVPAGSVTLELIGQSRGTSGLVAAGDARAQLKAAGSDSVVYATVMPGVDLGYQMVPGSLKEEIVLSAAPAGDAKGEFRFALGMEGLTADTAADGTVVFRDTKGVVMLSIPAGLAWDAKGASTKVAVRLVAAKGAADAELVVSVDEGWLGDAARVFPVTIDPSLSVLTAGDAFIYSATPDVAYQGWGQLDTTLGVFVDNVGYSGGNYRSFQPFDLSPFAGTNVISADWHGYAYAVAGTTPAAVTLRPIGGTWVNDTLSWTTQPWLRMNSIASGGYTGAGWQQAEITSWVQSWVSGTWPNYGIMLLGPSNGFVQLAAAIQENFSYIDVTYNRNPFVPTAALANDTALRANGGIGDLTPTLSVEVADPDGGTVSAEYEIWNNGHTTMIASGQSPYVASGLRASWTPGASLTNGLNYEYRVRAFDGTYASAWTAWGTWYTFKADTTPPAAPSISPTGFVAGSWSATSSGSFAFSSTSGDVKGYWWGLDDGEFPRNWVPGTTPSITISADTGWHDLVVRTQDKASWLSVATHFSFGVGSGGITVIEDEYDTNGTVQVGFESSASYNQVRLWYQQGFEAFQQVPAAHITNGLPGPAWPYGCTTCASPTNQYAAMSWDVAATRGSADGDGPISVRAEFANNGTWTGNYSNTIDLHLDQDPFAFGSSAAVPIGPGTADLITGNYSLGAVDVSVPGGGVSRSYETKADTTTDQGVFGPGWSDSTGSFQMPYRDLVINGTPITDAVLTTSDGSQVEFRYDTTTSSFISPEGSGVAGEPEDSLQLVAVGANYELRITDFATISFAAVSGGPTDTYYPVSFDDATNSDGDNVAWEYNPTTATVRPKTIVSAIAADVSCTIANAASTPGCASITFVYATTTTASGSTLGNYAGRLKTVTYCAFDPAASAPTIAGCDYLPSQSKMVKVDVAEYRYDSSGRLREVWDPRITPNLKTAYTYETSSPFRLLTLTPPGLETATLAYDTQGRISTVSHPALSPASGTVTTTVRYDIPLTTALGGPHTMTDTEIARWGQTDVPTIATAVFPPDQVPSGTPPASYTRATTFYMNAEGQVTNVAGPSGGGISTAEHDELGNIVRSLSAGNRQRALDQGSTTLKEASIAFRLDSRRVFDEDNTWLLLDEFGPDHTVTLDDGTLAEGRQHVRHFYDDGLPASLSAYEYYNSTGSPKPSAAATEPFLVETKTVRGFRRWEDSTSIDLRTTEFRYAWDLDRPADGIQDNERYGWDYGQPLATVTDPGGDDIATVNVYDSTSGRASERRLPTNATGGSATAATTKFRYYSPGPHPDLDTDCDNHPEWAGLACKSYPAAQPAGVTIPTDWTQSYGYYLGPTSQQQISGTNTRTTTIGYDSAGRPVTHDVGSNLGTDIPNVTTSYNASTGLPTTSSDGTRTITRVYDTLGRLTSYTDGDANTSSYSYDLLDRPLSVNDGKATTTISYGVNDDRGLPGTISDAQAGSFGASYNTDGQLVSETLPGSFTRNMSYDDLGRPMQMTLTKNGTTLLSEQLRWDSQGRWAYHATSGYSNQTYQYDNAGRLIQVDDTIPGSGCTSRLYAFDKNSNRTDLTTRTPPADGTCATSGGNTATNTYDTADRATLTGYTYNALGWTGRIPAADAPKAQDTTFAYYVNDLTRTITNNATTRTFTLDPARRYRTIIEAGVTSTNHYSGDSDSPAWTTTNTAGTNWTRHIRAFAGLEAIITRVGGVDTTKLQITNLHGDIITSADPTDTTLNDPTQETTEYGLPRDATNSRYDYLGTHQRHNDTTSGITLMGARNYNPATGRFTSIDPVIGGSANRYEYVGGDPVAHADLGGMARITLGGGSVKQWMLDYCGKRSLVLGCGRFVKGIVTTPRTDWINFTSLGGTIFGIGIQFNFAERQVSFKVTSSWKGYISTLFTTGWLDAEWICSFACESPPDNGDDGVRGDSYSQFGVWQQLCRKYATVTDLSLGRCT